MTVPQPPRADDSSPRQGEDAAHAPAAQDPPARGRHGNGNWRSLVISMVVLLGFVLVWMALTPRISEVKRTSVDVQASARMMAEQHRWSVLVPHLGPEWRPTSVSYDPDAEGVQVWHVGLHQGSQAEHYISVDQGKATGGDAARDAWVSTVTNNGTSNGTVTIDGRSWERLTSSGNVTRHSLVRRGENGEPTVVVVGIADPQQVQAAADSLAPYSAS